MSDLRNLQVAELGDRCALMAAIRFHAAEPDAGYMTERYEVERLFLSVSWTTAGERFGNHSANVELLGEDFGAFNEAYSAEIDAAACQPGEKAS